MFLVLELLNVAGHLDDPWSLSHVSVVFISLSYFVHFLACLTRSVSARLRKQFKGERGISVDSKHFGNEAFRKR